MYAPFFGLKREPFSIAPDPRYLFMSERHREALAHLLYGVRAGGGLVLLTGEIGAGKTTVCRCFLEQIPKRCNVAYIFNPRLTVEELLRSICEEFHVPLHEPAAAGGPQPKLTIKEYLDPLNDYLLKTHAVGQNNVLVIDEAQQLSAEVLEQLRLLTNLETAERKLLQVILIGQPELREVLARPELEQLAQRVIARFHLGALSEPETAQYVQHRLEVAGLKRPMPFTAEAITLVHRLARGVPRRINLLCDRAMLGAYAAGQPRIGRTLVRQAAAEVFDDTPAARASNFGATEPVAPRRPAAAGWPRGAVLATGAVLGAAAAALVGWGLAGRTATPGAITGDAASVPTVVAASASPASAGLALPAGGDTARGAASAPAVPAAAASAAIVAAAASAAAALDAPLGSRAVAAPASQASAVVAEAELEAEAWRALAAPWKLAADSNGGEDAVCRAARQKGLACHRGRTTLATLRQLDRPALLWLASSGTGPRAALLEAFTARGVRLRLGAVSQERPLATLQAQWRGEFATLWRPPPGYIAPQVEGRETPAAKWVAERLAKLQRDLPELITAAEASASDPLARDAAFEARVRAFQRSQGLSADGALGPITLMRLNRAAGIDEPRLAAPGSEGK